MDPFLGAALVSAGSSFIGGLMNSSASSKYQDQQMQLAQQNMANQKEFAQHGISWKVQDALASGVHPLAALGAQTIGYAPVSVGGGPNVAMGNALKSMGQDVSSAMMKNASQQERQAAIGAASVAGAQQVERGSLENELLRLRIRKAQQDLTSPGVPQPGQDFEHPMGKPESNPPLKFGGQVIAPDQGWSPMEAVEKRYGDEGPVNWGASIGVAMADAEKKFGPMSTWTPQLATFIWKKVSEELRSGSWISFERPWWTRSQPRPGGGGGW